MNGIKEHMKVVGKDGGHVGTVDGFEGTRIKLTKGSDGQHHYIDNQLVDSVEENTVKLSMDAMSVQVAGRELLRPCTASASVL